MFKRSAQLVLNHKIGAVLYATSVIGGSKRKWCDWTVTNCYRSRYWSKYSIRSGGCICVCVSGQYLSNCKWAL